ncbi:hypothetical protein, partial [Burkholderia multivorans]|uniref:hypothetical protein n=1 Tax=Burkholderia multivorans TaxID=87883 RepID=UPI001C613C48
NSYVNLKIATCLVRYADDRLIDQRFLIELNGLFRAALIRLPNPEVSAYGGKTLGRYDIVRLNASDDFRLAVKLGFSMRGSHRLNRHVLKNLQTSASGIRAD